MFAPGYDEVKSSSAGTLSAGRPPLRDRNGSGPVSFVLVCLDNVAECYYPSQGFVHDFYD